jgi:hypothetical protein
MHDAITLTCLVAARIEPRPWLRLLPPRRRQARARLGSLLVAIGWALQPEPDVDRRALVERHAATGRDLLDPAARCEL